MCGFDSCAHFAHVNLVRDRCLFCVRFLFVCTFGSCEFDSCFVCVFYSCTLDILVRVQFSFVCVLTRVRTFSSSCVPCPWFVCGFGTCAHFAC